MESDVTLLISEKEIEEKVKELGAAISSDYSGKTVHVVGILKGAWVFMADLVRRLTVPMTADFMNITSYGSDTVTSGTITLVSNLSSSIEGRHVLLVEDIVDTGLSLQYLMKTLGAREPGSLKVCALLDKPDRHQIDVHIDYLGFTIPDRFVVGYGIDYGEQFRNLPYIGYIEPSR